MFESVSALEVFGDTSKPTEPAQFDSLEDLCQEVDEQKLMTDIPASRREFIESPEMVATVKRRLNHLGYFKTQNRDHDVSTKFRAAVREFQLDAGITIDGWVGQQAWKVLEDLFSFEAQIEIGRWAEHPERERLLIRAAQLRLFAYGLVSVSPRERDIKINQGLSKFARICEQLKLSDTALKPELSAETLGVLFGIDEITRRLGKLRLNKPLDRFPKKQRKLLERFVVCHAKVELWLMGHNVVPNGTGNFFPVPRAGMKAATWKQKVKRGWGFFWSLASFCKDYNDTSVKGERRISAVSFMNKFPAVFRAIQTIRGADEDAVPLTVKTQQASAEMEKMADQNPGTFNREWGETASLGGRIRDGIRRAWGWIKRIVSRAIGSIVLAVRNLIRVTLHYARHGFGIIWAAIKSFPPAVRFFLGKDVEGGSTDSIVITHDRDFDWNLYIPSNPGLEQLRVVRHTFDLRTRQFSFATRCLSLLIAALARVAKYAIAGYAGLAIVLLRLRPNLEELMQFYLANRDWLLGKRDPMVSPQ